MKIDYTALDKMREEFNKYNPIDFDAIFDNPPAGSLADMCNKYAAMEQEKKGSMKPKKKMAKKIRALKRRVAEYASQLSEQDEAQESGRVANSVLLSLLKEQLAQKDDVINAQQARRLDMVKAGEDIKRHRDGLEAANKEAASENARLRRQLDRAKKQHTEIIAVADRVIAERDELLQKLKPKPKPKAKAKPKAKRKAPARRAKGKRV